MTKATTKFNFKRLLLRAAYFLVVLILVVLVAELTARFMGYRPLEPRVQTMKIEPQGRFYQDDSLLGYRGKPGTFRLLLNDSLSWTVTHDPQGWRTCGDESMGDSLPEIWILGCSFAHGYGVGDKEHFPAIVQSRLPGYRVRNYGMDAYGTLQNWLLLRDLLGQGLRPKLVILAYGAFHDQRNTANRYWRKALYGQQIAAGLRYPYVRLDDRDSLVGYFDSLAYHPLFMQEHLAFLSLLEERWNHSEDEGLRSREVTQILIQRIVAQCLWVESKFVLAGIYAHPETSHMLETFHVEGVSTVDIAENLDQPNLRILPGNGHPNAEAHKRMGDKLVEYLISEQLVQSEQMPKP